MSELLKYLGVALPVFTVFVCLWAWISSDPDRNDVVRGWVGSLFAQVSVNAERAAVAGNVNAAVNKLISEFGREPPQDVFPRIAIEWTNQDNVQSLLGSEEFVVRLKRHSYCAENVVLVARQLVRARVSEGRYNHVGGVWRKFIELHSTESFLFPEEDALHFFQQDVLGPLFADDKDFEAKYHLWSVMDKEEFEAKLHEADDSVLPRIEA